MTFSGLLGSPIGFTGGSGCLITFIFVSGFTIGFTCGFPCGLTSGLATGLVFGLTSYGLGLTTYGLGLISFRSSTIRGGSSAYFGSYCEATCKRDSGGLNTNVLLVSRATSLLSEGSKVSGTWIG